MIMLAMLACSTGTILPAPTATGPAVAFIAPVNNAVIAEGAAIEFAVHASDPGGVGKIDFFVDDVLMGSQTVSAGQTSFTAHQVWTASGVQGHFLSAIASRADNTKIGDTKISVRVVSSDTIALNPGSPGTSPATSAQATQPAESSASPVPATSLSGNPTAVPPTPTGPYIQVIWQNGLNIRAGDGTVFPTVGALKLNDTAQIIGRNATTTWWAIHTDRGVTGWIINNTTFITVNGDVSTVKLAVSPPTPQPTPIPTNALAPTSTTGAYADLVFGNVTLNPANPTANQTFNVSITITNSGNADAGTSLLVGVFQPGNEKSPVAVPAIKAGQSVTINMPVTLHSSGANQSGVLTLDANNEVNEGPNGKSNNTKTLTYNVN
jgi:hypothetical protein